MRHSFLLIVFCFLLQSNAFAQQSPIMRVVIKETTANNIEMDKPANINSKKAKLFYSLIDFYFENNGSTPQKMNVFFEGQNIATVQLISSATLAYVNDRDLNNDQFKSVVVYDPLPAKYSCTVYSETAIDDIKNKIKIFTDGKVVKSTFKFAVDVPQEPIKIESQSKPKIKNKKNG